MKKSRFTDSQILAILKQADSDVPVPGLCRLTEVHQELKETTGGYPE